MKQDDIWYLIWLTPGILLSLWVGLTPTLQTFIVLMVADIVTGLLAGGKHGGLDSDVSFRGMRKKGMQITLVLVLGFLGDNPRVGMPLGEVMAGMFCATELLSIIENAGRLGITFPEAVTAAVARLGNQPVEKK